MLGAHPNPVFVVHCKAELTVEQVARVRSVTAVDDAAPLTAFCVIAARLGFGSVPLNAPPSVPTLVDAAPAAMVGLGSVPPRTPPSVPTFVDAAPAAIFADVTTPGWMVAGTEPGPAAETSPVSPEIAVKPDVAVPTNCVEAQALLLLPGGIVGQKLKVCGVAGAT